MVNGGNALIGEEEHLQRYFDWNDGEEDFKPAHDLPSVMAGPTTHLDRPLEALDLALVLLHKLGWEHVGPELMSASPVTS